MSLDMVYHVVISMALLLSAAWGLWYGYRFIGKLSNNFENLKNQTNSGICLLCITLWLLLSSLFSLPIIEAASIIIRIAELIYKLGQPVSDNMISTGWGEAHLSVSVGIASLVLGLSYGYAAWTVPLFLNHPAIHERIRLTPRSPDGVLVILASGAVIHRLVGYILYGIQELPVSTWFGIKESSESYLFGWLVAAVILTGTIHLLKRVLNKAFEVKVSLQILPDRKIQ